MTDRKFQMICVYICAVGFALFGLFIITMAIIAYLYPLK